MNIIFHPKNENASKICCEYIRLLNDFKKNKLPDSIRKYANPTFIMEYRELFNKLPDKLSEKKELETRYIDFHSVQSKQL